LRLRVVVRMRDDDVRDCLRRNAKRGLAGVQARRTG
jgi:hypothetical protein